MNRIGFLLVAILLAPLAGAQVSEELLSEINGTVWQPFKQAFQSLDGEALNALYADDVLRVTPAGMDQAGAFKKANEVRFRDNVANGDSISLDFWFDSRHVDETAAYEVGFYRLGTTNRAGETSYFYGQFHIVLRRIEGRWQIVQDWDTTSIGGEPITKDLFDRGVPVAF